jgi:K+-sensing histidine kinase KdpD
VYNLCADPGRIEQLLANLLQNSFRHTAPGGVVTVKVEVVNRDVLIVVRNNGEGIAPFYDNLLIILLARPSSISLCLGIGSLLPV